MSRLTTTRTTATKPPATPRPSTSPRPCTDCEKGADGDDEREDEPSLCDWSDLSLTESWDYDSGYGGVFEMSDEESEENDSEDALDDAARRMIEFVFD